MKTNLDTLKTEIPQYLHSKGLAVFQGFVNELHEQKLVFWDIDHEPDYRMFVECAVNAGAHLIVFNHRRFQRRMVDDALENLEDTDLPREDQRAMERRLKELRSYEDFTCAIELAFEIQGRFYVYDLRTEWYEELLDLMEQIDSAASVGDLDDDDDDDEDNEEGRYFSRN
ncbi:MAG: hypothetical protein IANPNBLG_00421 [Bryobacteraceae bacterium]|nr:hypothetical protein [Bryobacteraceae bacterium]MCC6342590.1 hypothetical protein [Bryobacterales bacterium]